MERITLIVTETTEVAPNVRSLRLSRPGGEILPSWQPGAHIRIWLSDIEDRSYSLMNTVAEAGATTHPTAYNLGVRLEDPSQGGSRFMHALRVGDSVTISPPSNNFPLEPSAAPIVLVAGGIGVTPILAMAAELRGASLPFRFHFAGRSRAHLPFLIQAERIAGSALHVHADDEAGHVFDMPNLMATLTDDEPLYVCGPLPMIEAARATAATLGWRDGRLRFELFTAPVAQAGDATFDVTLKQTGRTFTVPPGKTILDVLIDAGEDPMYDCRRGDCGICQVTVLEGVPDHRDFILSDAERASNRLMQICISRAKSPLLVLDL